MVRWGGVGLGLACLMAGPGMAAETKLDLMPWPASLTVSDGRLIVDAGFKVAVTGHADPRVDRAVARFAERLRRQTGYMLASPRIEDVANAGLEVHCEGPADALPSLRMDETYTLEIAPAEAKLKATTPFGVLRGLETFLQLVAWGEDGFFVPTVVIKDRPRFPWRGLLLDSGRHFMPIEVVERTLDGMAAVKMNVLHWHLTDDQGFRIESKRFPKLHEMGSDGAYYTQDQARAIIAYAADRGIRVVPEFDMPGHTTSWLVGHPELGTGPGPYELQRRWGVFEPVLDPSREEVYQFLDGFLGEMATLFPDPYLHVGGDEVEGKPWERSPEISAFKQAHGLKSNHDFEVYFITRVSKIVTGHGKKMMGWDEVLHPDLPRTTILHSWRGPKALGQAVRMGFEGLLSYGYYLDLIFSAATHYAQDPLDKETAALGEAEKARILGGEACMWSEFVSPETIDSRIWPRAAAVAERLWSPADVRDVDDMYRRLEATSRHLAYIGITHRSSYRPMLERLAGPGPLPEALVDLADIVEPLKEYNRPQTMVYTSLTPLNRLVDAARPESDVARRFSRRVDRYLAGPNATDRDALRADLQGWREIKTQLGSALEAPPLREIQPLAADVSALAEAGLEALAYLDKKQTAEAAWWERRAAILKRPERPVHALEIAVLPPIRRLMEAARGPSK
jgi:hexosaminidase